MYGTNMYGPTIAPKNEAKTEPTIASSSQAGPPPIREISYAVIDEEISIPDKQYAGVKGKKLSTKKRDARKRAIKEKE